MRIFYILFLILILFYILFKILILNPVYILFLQHISIQMLNFIRNTWHVLDLIKFMVEKVDSPT